MSHFEILTVLFTFPSIFLPTKQSVSVNKLNWESGSLGQPYIFKISHGNPIWFLIPSVRCNLLQQVLIILCNDQSQIVGTSNNPQKMKHSKAMGSSDSEDSYSSSSHGRSKSSNKIQSFTPSTPPPTSVNYRTAKRRKGIPHRAPMGGLIIEY